MNMEEVINKVEKIWMSGSKYSEDLEQQEFIKLARLGLGLSKKVQSREFYELCQSYRHTPIDKFIEVQKAYQDIQKFIETTSSPSSTSEEKK